VRWRGWLATSPVAESRCCAQNLRTLHRGPISYGARPSAFFTLTPKLFTLTLQECAPAPHGGACVWRVRGLRWVWDDDISVNISVIRHSVLVLTVNISVIRHGEAVAASQLIATTDNSGTLTPQECAPAHS
jgi:hypothetical protein